MGFYVEGVTLTCCNKDCGMSFQVPGWWDKGRRETHAIFYCPNGHQQSYQVESETEKMRRERNTAQQQLARAEQEASDANKRADLAQKQKRKLEKRMAAGTCPCCQRTFSNMAEHMKHQHPEFVEDSGAKVVPIKRAAK